MERKNIYELADEFGKQAKEGLGTEEQIKVFEEAKQSKIPGTRIVNLKIKCSTCGSNHDGYYHRETREVPYDSPLKDGDYVHVPEDLGMRNYANWGD